MLKQLSNYILIKECGNTLGVKVYIIIDLVSKKTYKIPILSD